MKREREIRDEFVKSGHIEHYDILRARKHGQCLNLIEALQAIYEGSSGYRLPSHDSDLLQNLGHLIRNDENYLNLLTGVVRKGNTILLHQHELRWGLKNMSNNAKRMIRSVADWNPPRGNSRNRFGHLLRHLFCKYQVPRCMENVWLKGTDDDRAFLMSLGYGTPIYKHPYLKDVVLSRKMAHLFRQAPSNCNLVQAIRWAQIYSIRRDKRLYRAVANSFLGESSDNDDFWTKVIFWLCRTPQLDYRSIQQVLVYINFQKFGKFKMGEYFLSLPAPNPDFDIAGKNFAGVAKTMRKFYERLEIEYDWKNCSWIPAPIPNHDWGIVPDEKGVPTQYVIEQLLTKQDLVQEGIRMNHCVGTYIQYCKEGRSSIWSLQKVEKKGNVPLLTVEIDNYQTEIEQAKGVGNRLPTPFEIEMLKEWAKIVQVKIADYAFN